MVELDGEHRGDGCSRAAFQQHDDLRDHAVAEEPQRGESCDGQHRNEKHSDYGELPDVLIGEGAVQVARGDEHTGDEHGEGSVHVAQKLHGLDDEVGQRDLEQVDGKTHDDGVDGRAVQQALGDLFGVGAAADHAVAHRPEQEIEHGKEGAGIKQALGAEERRNEGQAHIARIGENTGEPEDGRPAVPAAGREQQGDDESQQDGQGAQGERGHEVVQNFCAELHAVGVDDHGRDDEVDQQVRESLLALGAEQAGLGTKSPQPYEDEQFRHLLGGDDSKVHNKLPSLQDDVLDEQRNTAVLGVEKFHRRILGEDLGRDLYLDAAGGVDAAALHPADAGG